MTIGLIIGYLIATLHYKKNVKSHRQDAITKSQSVILWHVNEKIAPLLPQFPYSYKDLVFIGKGVDYIVFDGLSTWFIRKVVFLEIKSGKSQLNSNEKTLQSAIDQKRVSYETLRL